MVVFECPALYTRQCFDETFCGATSSPASRLAQSGSATTQTPSDARRLRIAFANLLILQVMDLGASFDTPALKGD
jgi:hypothetical protein